MLFSRAVGVGRRRRRRLTTVVAKRIWWLWVHSVSPVGAHIHFEQFFANTQSTVNEYRRKHGLPWADAHPLIQRHPVAPTTMHVE